MPALAASYLDIVEDLQRKIALGTYAPGAKLPSYRELAGLYRVSPTTVQRSLALLRYDGVVIGRQGRGVFVAGPSPLRREPEIDE